MAAYSLFCAYISGLCFISSLAVSGGDPRHPIINQGSRSSADPDPGTIISRCTFNDANGAADWCNFTPVQHDSNGLSWSVSAGKDIPLRPPTIPRPNMVAWTSLTNAENRQIKREMRSAEYPAPPTSTNYCLKFFLYMESHDMSTFRVVQRISSQELDLMVFVSDDVKAWKQRQLDFSSDKAFNISFIVDLARNGNNQGQLAIDDVFLYDGICHPNNNASQNLQVGELCDFEEGNCGLTNGLNTGPTSWIITSYNKLVPYGAISTELTPTRDHTNGAPSGHYAYAEIKGTQEVFYQSAELNYSRHAGQCLTFYYRNHQLPHSGEIALEVLYREINQTSQLIWLSAVDYGKNWVAVSRTLPHLQQTGKYTLTFKAAADTLAWGGLALDDISVADEPCPTAGACTFLDGFCGWTNVEDAYYGAGNLRWLNGREQSGPPVPEGRYLYIKMDGSGHFAPGSRAIIYSPNFLPPLVSRADQCVQFSYLITSNGAAVVRLFDVVNAYGTIAIWENYGRDPAPAPNTWNQAMAPIRPETSMLGFETVILRETEAKYFIIISNVLFTSEPCPVHPTDSKPIPEAETPSDYPDAICTFDEDPAEPPMCGWSVVDGTQGIQWEVKTGVNSVDKPFMPKFDRTTSQSTGSFLYYDISAVSTPEKVTAKIRTKTFQRSTPDEEASFRFWYFAFDESQGDLAFQVRATEPEDKEILSIQPSVGGGTWREYCGRVPAGHLQYYVVFEASTRVSTDGTRKGGIALDDIAAMKHGCIDVACDFEHGSCAWANSVSGTGVSAGSDQLDWHFATSEVLPNIPDEEGKHGHFMYVPIRDSTPSFYKAWLRNAAQPTDLNNLRCVEFDYIFTMGNLGKLSVIWSALDPANSEAVNLWTEKGFIGAGTWQRGQVFLDRKNKNWALFFEVTANVDGIEVPADRTHGIAIDNINYSVVQNVNQCLRRPETLSFDCTFDVSGICSYEVDDNSTAVPSYAWKLMQAKKAWENGGPHVDQTTGLMDGWYMYHYSNNKDDEGKKTRLTSAFFGDMTHRCITFYYHAQGEGVGSLNVLASTRTITDGYDTTAQVIWSRHEPDEGYVWQRAQVDVDADAEVHTIIFEAVAGHGKGDIALDSISASEGVCHRDNTFCDFERGFCNFKHATDDNDTISWQVVSKSGSPIQPGIPDKDVTLQSDEGHFFYAYGKPFGSEVSKAITNTVNYKPDTSRRCFQFFYFLKTSDMHVFDDTPNLFTVAVVELPNKRTAKLRLDDIPKGIHEEWRLFNFAAPYTEFFVEFQTDLAVLAGVSIDDVSLKDEECTALFDCPFDSDSSCKWKGVIDTNLATTDWKIDSRISPNFTVGPPTDHTSGAEGKGWMALAIGGGAARHALLVSPTILPGNDVCLKFWYYLSENTNERVPCALNVFTRVETSTGRTTWLWNVNQVTTTQSTGKWLEGTVGRSETSYEKITFKADLGHGSSCFVALDDITLTSDTCKTFPVEADPYDIELQCNFDDNSTCAFDNHPISQATEHCFWDLRKGPGLHYPLTGPQLDYTNQDATGGYLYFQASLCLDRPAGEKPVGAFITRSELANFKAPQQCLRFYYHMHGAPNVFQVYTNYTDGTGTKQFERRGDQSNEWIRADLRIDNPDKDPYKLIFKAMAGASRLGDMAVDGVYLQDGPCQMAREICDFSDHPSLCSFTRHATMGAPASFNWNSVKLTDPATANLPAKFDHTTMTSEGYVAFFQGNNLAGDLKAYLIGPKQTQLPTGQDKCVTFWYQTSKTAGADSLVLHVLRAADTTNTFPPPSWRARTGLSSSWEYATVPMTLKEDFKYAFGAVNGAGNAFALDDILVLNERCPTDLTCNFENGLCGWKGVPNDPDDKVEWILFHGGDDNSDAAGPATDNTLYPDTDGHYVFLSNVYPENNTAGVDAIFQSPLVAVTNGSPTTWCFTFYFDLYTETSLNNARLELLILRAGNDIPQSLHVVDTLQRNLWTKRSVEIGQITADFRLLFNGTLKGTEKKNAIALDDLYGYPGACEPTPPKTFKCANGGAVINFSQVCDQVKDCPSREDEAHCGSCKFEGNTSVTNCGYTNFQNDDFSISPTKKGTAISSGTSGAGAGDPPSDFYLLADFKNGSLRSSTYLDSPWLHETAATCKVSFWYNMFSMVKEGGTIIVTLEKENVETIIAILDQPTSTTGWAWKNYIADFGRMSGEFRLVFRVRKPGIEAKGYVALDSVSMLGCDFHLPTTGDCPVGEWKCPKTNVCVFNEQRCDFTDDCGKAEDEDEAVCKISHPVRCNFETGLCDWASDPADPIKWVQASGRSSTPYSGPLRDHTTGLKTGSYALMKSSVLPADVGKTATLLNNQVLQSHTTANNCLLRFYWHMYGSTMGTLRVLMVNTALPSAAPAEVFKQDALDYGDTWHRQSVQLSSPATFKVKFVGEMGGNSSDIALDDISFSDNCKFVGSGPVTTPRSPLTTKRRTPQADPDTTPVIPVVDATGPVAHPNDIGGGAIAGIVVGVLLCFVLAGVAMFIVQRRRSVTARGTGVDLGYMNFGILSDQDAGDSSTDGNNKIFNDLHSGDL